MRDNQRQELHEQEFKQRINRLFLSNLKLWNFRKFGFGSDFNIKTPNLNLNFKKGLNVLIGENDSGKSAIIDAIKIILKTHSFEWIRISEDDFYQDTLRFRIELLFENLLDDEAKNFTEWLGWKGEGERAEPYLRLIYDISRKEGEIFPSDVRAGVDDEGYKLTAGAREYLKVTYLKPLRDAKAEFVPKKNSRLSQILQAHEAFKGQNESHSLVNLFNHFNQSIEKYFEGKTPSTDSKDGWMDADDTKGKELKKKLDRLIHELYDKTKDSNFTVSEGKLKNILEKLELSIKDEINPGLGTLNRLFMASELLHLGKANWNGVRLGLIEEIEAHLHPQAQMQIIESLQKKDDIQIILTTHSPSLASKIKLENLIICHKSNAFPMGNKYTGLDAPDYVFLERFLDTTKANLFFAKGVILVEGWAEELLIPALAEKIGFNLTEKGVSVVNVGNTALLRYSKIFKRTYRREIEEKKVEIKKIASTYKIFLDDLETVESDLIDPKISKYFKWVIDNYAEIDIPISVITDVDVLPFEANPMKPDPKDNRKNGKEPYSKFEIKDLIKKKYSDLKIKYDGQRVKTFISPYWTLEYCFFKSQSIGSQFQKIVKSIHSGTDWDRFSKSLTEKLKNKGLKKTEIAYQLAQMLGVDCQKARPEIVIDPDDSAIQYLCDAIKYACKN